MTSPALAALALSAALVMPVPRRVAPAPSGRGRGALTVAAGGAAVGAVVAVATLPLTTVLAATVLAVTVVIRCRRRRRTRRRLAEGRELHTALHTLVGELQVGAHPVRALSVAADETAGVGASLRVAAAHARLGAEVSAGLRGVAERSALAAHWERLAVCWRLADEHGLAISTLLRAAQQDIAERHRFSARVDAELAGARATAAILAGLPVLGVALGEVIGAAPVGFLLDGRTGGWLLVTGVTLSCAGLLWSDRIADRVSG